MNSGGDNTTVDTLIACQIYHAASQIRVLKDTLRYLGERTDEEISKNRLLSPEEKEGLKSRIIYKKICHCIDHYEAIYKYVIKEKITKLLNKFAIGFRFVKDLESTYSLVAFSQMFSSIVVICICCLHLSVVSKRSAITIFVKANSTVGGIRYGHLHLAYLCSSVMIKSE